VWDAFFADSRNRTKYGWYRNNAIPYWSLLEEVFGDRIAIGDNTVTLGNLLEDEDLGEQETQDTQETQET